MAGTATGVATSAARKAPMGGTKGLALLTKKGSPTKVASNCRRRPAPRYKAPTQQDFSDKELACLLASRQAEAVVDTGVEAGVVLKKTKSKAIVDLAIHQAFKEERGACNKCWVDNNSEGCWYSVSAPLCFWCTAMKRPCTLDGAKIRERGNAPNPMVEKTYHWAVLKVQEAEAQEEAIGLSLSKKSLALPMHQGDEERGSSKGKCKASLPLSPMDKGKKRVRVVSLAAVTPEVESEDEARCLSAAIEASKAAPGMEDLAGPSCQAEAPQDVGAPPEEMERDEAEEEAKVGLEMTPQAQP
ncbi:hypothetical protein C0993_000601 [Termitomyces sp. T159_Od127]|nr:hypothetical protein C0993_000601 [Termitomyces sp. T159_Od127]